MSEGQSKLSIYRIKLYKSGMSLLTKKSSNWQVKISSETTSQLKF